MENEKNENMPGMIFMMFSSSVDICLKKHERHSPTLPPYLMSASGDFLSTFLNRM
jgi:hypothetical protein